MTHVCIMVPLEWAYTRQVVLGVREYSRQKPDWRLVWSREPGPWPGGAGPGAGCGARAGVVARITTPAAARALRALGLPCVNVSGLLRYCAVPRVMPDDRAIGRLAACHLLERGYRHLLFVGEEAAYFSREREAGFADAARAGGAASCRSVGARSLARSGVLKAASRPLGIAVCLDDMGPEVIGACRRAGLEIPREAAVVGVNNDEVFCDLADVPLSSVDPDAARVGFEAARLLDDMMCGRRPPAGPVLVPPRGIVVRASSDNYALDDKDLAAALQFMHRHACDPVTVKELMPHLGISRRTLEQRFRARFGRSLHAEIRRLRMERAQRLLAETDVPVAEVARRCGFAYVNRFAQVFRKHAADTPGRYRARHGVRRHAGAAEAGRREDGGRGAA